MKGYIRKKCGNCVHYDRSLFNVGYEVKAECFKDYGLVEPATGKRIKITAASNRKKNGRCGLEGKDYEAIGGSFFDKLTNIFKSIFRF